jgi:MFS family permease
MRWGAVMRPQLKSVAAILLAALIFLVGNGLLQTLIPVRAHIEGFSTLVIGLIGSAYFAGFVAGCFIAPRWLARVGHVRTFAVCAGICAAATLLQPVWVSVIGWVLLRGLFGTAAAAMYMTVESWLNDRARNETRGVVFAAYLAVNFAGLIVGQLLTATARPESFVLFSLATVFYALCLMPLGLTDLPQPAPAPVARLRPIQLFRASPVGVAGCIAVGLANAAVWTLAPVYARTQGLSSGNVALFMVAFTFGGMLVQLPVGRLSDRVDRRWVIVATCILAAAAGVAIALFGSRDRTVMLATIFGFGVLMLPVYGLMAAHTNDRVPRQSYVEVSATLLLVNSIAAVAGPTFAAAVMQRFGSPALFFFTAAVHAGLAAFALIRIRQSAPPQQRVVVDRDRD